MKWKNYHFKHEVIEAYQENKLVGGFSQSYSNNSNLDTVDNEQSNNCLGGNCAPGCGLYGNNDSGCTHNVQPLCS